MLNKEQIMEILPHRPPMLLVDEILEMDENHVVGALHLTGDEFFFQGHFPGNPIMPAVFRLEALAQAGCCLCPNSRARLRSTPALTRRNSAQWQSRAIPFVWKSLSPSAAARWQ